MSNRLPRTIASAALMTLVLSCGAQAQSEQTLRAQAENDGVMGLPIEIYLDQARVLKMPEKTATLVVGNPLIADVSVQTGGLLVVTGKGYGVTNVIALDRDGALLMEHPIEVMGPRDRVVTVFRGTERESYSCAPKCERRVTLGDTAPYFTQTLGQTTAINAQAQSQSQPR